MRAVRRYVRHSIACVALGVASAVSALGAAGAQAPTAAVTTSSSSWAHVTYLSGQSVYLDAGTRQGLRAGSTLEVLRGDTLVAELSVEYVSSTRSSCRIVRSNIPVAIGDSARFTPAATLSGPVVANAPDDATPSVRQSRRAQRPIRGRLGVRYLTIDPGIGASGVIRQPALDLRLDGHRVNGSPFGITVDARAHRDRTVHRDSSGVRTYEPTSITRVYQSALEFNPLESGIRVAAGRQFSSALSTIGIFDGVAIDADHSRWAIGALAGTQPEPTSFGLSSDIREYGSYLQLHNSSAGAPNALWSATVGGIGSYARGEIDREFLYFQSSYNARVISLYAVQELDLNRGWKRDAEGSATVPTSTFALMRISVAPAVTLNAGFDNRRSVRLYRDRLTPEIEFDDSFRRGAWGGASLALGSHLHASADARRSTGGAGDATESITGIIGLSRMTALQFGFHARTTSYTGAMAQGRLVAGSVDISPFSLFHLEGGGGTRRDKQSAGLGSAPSATWWEVNADVGVGRSVYLLTSLYRERSADARSSQMYVALSYRF